MKIQKLTGLIAAPFTPMHKDGSVNVSIIPAYYELLKANGVTGAFISTPGKISAGYNWTDSSNNDGIQRSTTYTVKEMRGNDAVITIAGTLNTDTKAQMQGMDIVNKSKGKISGEEIVDITTGVIKQRTTTLETSGTMQAQGFEIPMTSKITFVSAVKPA